MFEQQSQRMTDCAPQLLSISVACSAVLSALILSDMMSTECETKLSALWICFTFLTIRSACCACVYISYIHYVKKVFGHLHIKFPKAFMRSYNLRHQYGVGAPFAATKASTPLGRISTRVWNKSVEIFSHSSRRAFVRSDTDAGLTSFDLVHPKGVQWG